MRLGCELFLWPPVAPPAGDGFFYPNLEQRGEVVVDVTLKKAEVLLEAGSFQECQDYVCAELLEGGDAVQCPRALRLLLHSYRCQGKLSWAKHLAEEQLRKDLEKQAKAMLKLTLAELQFADRNGPAAKRLAKEALADFFELDMPSYEGFCLLVLAHEALAGESYGFAEKYASDALERFQDDGHSHGLGRALLTLAEVQTAAQNPAAALSAEKALEVFKFCQDEVWQAFVLQKRAGWAWDQDDAGGAATFAEAAMFLWESNGHPLQREAEIAEIACVAFITLQHPEEAMRLLRACLHRARAVGERNLEGHMLYASIHVNQAMGDMEGAARVADKARGVFHDLENRRMELAALRAKCSVQITGPAPDPTALQTAKEAMAGAEQLASGQDEELGNAWLQMSRLRSAKEETVNARKALEMAVTRFEAAGKRRHASAAGLELAQLNARMQDYSGAEDLATKVRELCRRHQDTKGEASALLVTAAVLLQRHCALKAFKAAEEAFELFSQVGDRLREAEALLLVSQAGHQHCVVSEDDAATKHRLFYGASVQAANGAMAIAERLQHQWLKAQSHLALAQIQVLSKPLLQEAYSNALQASDLFSQMGHAAGTACSFELQASAAHHLGHADTTVEALNKAKQVYAQAKMGPSLARCEALLLQMGAGTAVVEPRESPKAGKPKQEPLPLPLGLPKREPRVVKDPALLHGKDRVMAQVTHILQDLGVEEIDLDDGLMSSGLTSRAAVQLRGEMEQAFGSIRFPSTLAFDYPNIRMLSDWIMEQTQAAG